MAYYTFFFSVLKDLVYRKPLFRLKKVLVGKDNKKENNSKVVSALLHVE